MTKRTGLLGRNWWTGIGAIVAVAGVVIALLAWLAPRPPATSGGATPAPPSAGVPSSGSAGPVTSPPSNTVDSASYARTLVDLVDSRIVENCTGNAELATGGRIAVIDCSAPRPGPFLVRVERFADRAALDDWLSGSAWTVPQLGNDCAENLHIQPWRTNRGERPGRIHCGPSGSQHWILWTFDDQLIGVLAKGTTGGSAMFGWWGGNALLLKLSTMRGADSAGVG